MPANTRNYGGGGLLLIWLHLFLVNWWNGEGYAAGQAHASWGVVGLCFAAR
jgi:hypothetical protein